MKRQYKLIIECLKKEDNPKGNFFIVLEHLENIINTGLHDNDFKCKVMEIKKK